MQERLAKLSGGVAVLKVFNLIAICILSETKYTETFRKDPNFSNMPIVEGILI